MDENNEVLLFSTMNENEINQVCAILNDNEIPFIRRDSGSGSYMTIYMGFSLQEKCIYIAEKDFERAQELICGMFSEDVEYEEIPELKEEPISENEEKEYNEKQKVLKKLFKLWYVDLGIIMIVLILILELLSWL